MRLPFVDDSFDLALSITSIKHWPDPVQGMREVLRVLRPGGRFFVGEVNQEAAAWEAGHFVRALGVPPILRRPVGRMFRRFVLPTGWTSNDAQNTAASLGLADCRVQRMNVPPLVAVIGTKPRR